MGRQVSVYIRAEDLDLWRRAEAYAGERRIPMSGLVMLALERYLNDEKGSETARTPGGK